MNRGRPVHNCPWVSSTSDRPVIIAPSKSDFFHISPQIMLEVTVAPASMVFLGQILTSALMTASSPMEVSSATMTPSWMVTPRPTRTLEQITLSVILAPFLT